MWPQDIEQKRLYKWLNALVIAQILFSALMLSSPIREFATLISFRLPTPSCPEGRGDMLIPYEIGQQCWEETKSIYLKGMVEAARIGFVGCHLCMVGAIITWLISKEDLKLVRHRALIAYGVFFVLCLISPYGGANLFKIIWYGEF